MSDEWRTDEPEVGQVALLEFLGMDFLGLCKGGDFGKKWWHFNSNLQMPIGTRWKPITTPEETRLRKGVAELEGLLRWRKWPEEKPEKSGRYLKLLRDRCEELTRFNLDEYCKVTQKWWGGDPIYWRPIGNLPEGGE